MFTDYLLEIDSSETPEKLNQLKITINKNFILSSLEMSMLNIRIFNRLAKMVQQNANRLI